MNRFIHILAFLILLQASLTGYLHADEAAVRTQTVTSEPVRVERVYKSMEGPYVRRPIPIDHDPQKVELLWLKKVALEFIDGKDNTPRPMSYLCHGHLIVDQPGVAALFTLIQGQNAVDLPGNFAVPVLSNHPLEYYAQILNLTDTEDPFDLRVKTTLDYIRDADATTPMIPVYQMSMILKIPITPETAELVANNAHCSLASRDGAVEIVPSGSLGLRADSEGNAFSIHWNVPPGKHAYSYDLTREEIRAKTGSRIHFATIHLHPYGRSMELLDMTTKTSVFKIDASVDPTNGGIEKVNHFYSEEGIPLDLDHQYRVMSEYDNPLQRSVDAMAIMYLYVHDKDFERAVLDKRAGK